MLKIGIGSVFLLFILFKVYQLFQVLLKMRRPIQFPANNDEALDIRRFPQKALKYPTYANLRGGLITYSIILMILVAVFISSMLLEEFDWPFYFLFIIPLINSNNLLHLFAVVENGIIIGHRFIPWKRMKSFHFVQVDINHNYYGFSKEVNEGQELKIKTAFATKSLLVTSKSAQEKLTNLLVDHGLENNSQ
jgi:hypothetical protein